MYERVYIKSNNNDLRRSLDRKPRMLIYCREYWNKTTCIVVFHLLTIFLLHGSGEVGPLHNSRKTLFFFPITHRIVIHYSCWVLNVRNRVVYLPLTHKTSRGCQKVKSRPYYYYSDRVVPPSVRSWITKRAALRIIFDPPDFHYRWSIIQHVTSCARYPQSSLLILISPCVCVRYVAYRIMTLMLYPKVSYATDGGEARRRKKNDWRRYGR